MRSAISADARLRYRTNCVNCPGPDAGAAIQAMQDAARPVSRRTFLRRVDAQERRELEQSLGYALDPRAGLTMQKDWHVAYYRSVFRGQPCYFFDYSRIEYIFTAGGKNDPR